MYIDERVIETIVTPGRHCQLRRFFGFFFYILWKISEPKCRMWALKVIRFCKFNYCSLNCRFLIGLYERVTFKKLSPAPPWDTVNCLARVSQSKVGILTWSIIIWYVHNKKVSIVHGCPHSHCHFLSLVDHETGVKIVILALTLIRQIKS